MAKCDIIKGVEKHGPDTDTAGKEGGLEGLTRTKEHPDQVEKDRSSLYVNSDSDSDSLEAHI